MHHDYISKSLTNKLLIFVLSVINCVERACNFEVEVAYIDVVRRVSIAAVTAPQRCHRVTCLNIYNITTITRH